MKVLVADDGSAYTDAALDRNAACSVEVVR